MFYLFSDVDQLLGDIVEVKPFWGSAQPKAWFTFMWFGLGIKCRDQHAEPRAWTVTSARGLSRKGTGRTSQRDKTISARERLRADADARLRSQQQPEAVPRELLAEMKQFNTLAARKQRVQELYLKFLIQQHQQKQQMTGSEAAAANELIEVIDTPMRDPTPVENADAPDVTNDVVPAATNDADPDATNDVVPAATSDAAPATTNGAVPDVTNDAAPSSVTNDVAPAVTSDAAPAVTNGGVSTGDAESDPVPFKSVLGLPNDTTSIKGGMVWLSAQPTYDVFKGVGQACPSVSSWRQVLSSAQSKKFCRSLAVSPLDVLQQCMTYDVYANMMYALVDCHPHLKTHLQPVLQKRVLTDHDVNGFDYRTAPRGVQSAAPAPPASQSITRSASATHKRRRTNNSGTLGPSRRKSNRLVPSRGSYRGVTR